MSAVMETSHPIDGVSVDWIVMFAINVEFLKADIG